MTVNSTSGVGPKRREKKSERTRRRILDAAAEVLSRRGFDGTRISEIAELAELRLPAVYYYFESREALLEEVVNIGGRRAMENVETRLGALPAGATALDRVCTAFGAHLETVLTESTYVAAAIRTMAQLPADIRERQLHTQREQAERWRTLINEAVESGEMDPDLDPRGARMLLLGAVNWAPEWWHPERGSVEDTVALVQRLVRNALTPSPDPGGRAQAGDTTVRSPGLTPLFAAPGRP